MSILVLAEHDNKSLKASTLNTITAAAELASKGAGEGVDVCVLGTGCKEVATQAAAVAGVRSVLCGEAPYLEHQQAEAVAPIVASLSGEYTYLLAPASTFGKNIFPRVAALLNCSQLSDVIAIESSDTFVRPIYAGNAFATYQTTEEKKVLTIRGTAFNAAASGGSAEVKEISLDHLAKGEGCTTSFVGQELSKSERPELTEAKVVVSGGRGLGDKEKFNQVMEDLADALGAAIGASRAAVDAGYVPNDYQVGQTGKVVAPELYIAVGISGAIQHLAGMKDSKVIVAINSDPDAPIFEIADYGLVGDLFEVVPKLTEMIRANGN